MAHQNSYYLYQKWEGRRGQQFVPSEPPCYSVDGDGTKQRVLKQENDPNCPIDDLYRWYAKSPSDYVCVGNDKYYREYYQVSYDEGETWQDVEPTETRRGDLIETGSLDCGGTYADELLTFVADDEDVFIKYTSEQADASYQIFNYSIDDEPIGSHAWYKNEYVHLKRGQKMKILMPWQSVPRTDALVPFFWYEITLHMSFSSVGRFKVEGNPLLTISYGAGKFKTLQDIPSGLGRIYLTKLFDGCIYLTDASNLSLPSLSLKTQSGDMLHYNYMFQNCYALRVPPVLPATTLDGYTGYHRMFTNCFNLETAPELPATTNIYYDRMFGNCTSLKNAPVLSAATLTGNCYDNMFVGCTSLSAITCLATNISSSSCTTNWVRDVSPTGIFTKPSTTNWTIGDDGIPSGWTVNNIQPTNTKWVATYSDSHTESAACDASSAITGGEIAQTDLISVEIGQCVTAINEYAFAFYSGMTSVTIPNSVTTISAHAFRNCTNLTLITIPSSTTSIGNFAFYYCNSLTGITIDATTPPTLGNYAFNNTNNCPIYVPSGSVNAYKSANEWSTYASRIQAIP